MGNARRNALLFVLAGISAAGAARVGMGLYKVYRPYNSPESVAPADAAFQASARVLELLNRTDAPPPTMDGSHPCVFEDVGQTDPPPQIGKCNLPTTLSGPVDRFEADLRYGSFVLRQTDLYVKDIFDVPLTRTYNSGDWVGSNPVHAFGKFANHPFDISPFGSRFPYTEQMLVFEDGDFLYLPRVSEGTSFQDAIYQHTETSTSFYKAVTAWNGNGWTTWRTDGFAMVFPEAYNAKNMAQGAATEMRDADGNRLQLIRDGRRNLLEIRTPHKHWIKFQYDDQARIIRADDDQKRWSQYAYDGLGMLTDVTIYSGQKRHYSYNGDLMTTIQDENQRVLLRNTYNGRFLSAQDFGNGQVYSYSYSPSASGTYAETVEVTLPDGTTTRLGTGDSVSAKVRQQH
jgi:YD repeat-containing protein